VKIISRHLVDSERRGVHAAVEAKDAATLIIIDRSADVPKVLLGRRHDRHMFMPGKFVFPGGRVEIADRLMAAGALLDPAVERKLLNQTRLSEPCDAAAFPLAAIRETFEETGLIVGKPGEVQGEPPDGPWKKFAQIGFVPIPGALHFIARAITPPGFPRRFDARFFSVDRDQILHQLDGVVHAQAELIEVTWLPIAQALDLDMPLITGIVLEELEQRIAARFSRELPVPFYATRHGEFTRDLIE